MTIQIGLTDELTNTQFAPLAALAAHFREEDRLAPLKQVRIPMNTRDLSPVDKLTQMLVSILAGCETLVEVNSKLKSEVGLAMAWGWERFADQSSLSRTADELTLKNSDQLRCSTTSIWRVRSQARLHDWRGFLWLDYDLSGLPCSPRAEESQKGYFSGKKTSVGASWHGSAPSNTGRPSGQTCIQATV